MAMLLCSSFSSRLLVVDNSQVWKRRAGVLMKIKNNTKPKPNTTHKAAERQRKREAGLAPMEVWVRPVDKPKVRAFVAGLNKDVK